MISLRNQPPAETPLEPAKKGLMPNSAIASSHKLHAAAEIQPAHDLARHQAERDRAEIVERLGLAEPEERRGMRQLGDALLDRIERLERRHQLARGVQLDGQAAGAHRADPVGEALGVDPDARRVLRPGRDHPPLDPLLRDRRRGERARPQAAPLASMARRSTVMALPPLIRPPARPPLDQPLTAAR